MPLLNEPDISLSSGSVPDGMLCARDVPCCIVRHRHRSGPSTCRETTVLPRLCCPALTPLLSAARCLSSAARYLSRPFGRLLLRLIRDSLQFSCMTSFHCLLLGSLARPMFSSSDELSSPNLWLIGLRSAAGSNLGRRSSSLRRRLHGVTRRGRPGAAAAPQSIIQPSSGPLEPRTGPAQTALGAVGGRPSGDPGPGVWAG